MAVWHDISSARDQWIDAPSDDDALTELLATAKQQVIAYAPTLADYATIPDHYRYGQLRQTQNLWNAARVDPTGGVGDGGDFIMRPHPLDWHVKQILRPRRAVPNVR